MSDENPLWSDDLIQFARLLDEIQACGSESALSEMKEVVAASMDLSEEEVDSLFDRASSVWHRAKATRLGHAPMETGPWTDGSDASFTPYVDPTHNTAGFRCEVNGSTSYVFLLPSDGGDSPDVFVYKNDTGDPADDGAVVFVGFEKKED